ncbi:NitT/TauT family transport system substrate-binding protein [Geosporobacter subterraneus DSM 17957]|uniref:NitT/TauT family transport system substrate-binding protein n=1 Tax=Geosporobacter subterraneus DSM 17957 TaxID=1121919 RepID=A0A1M6HZ34_9FIRM|nr:MetQ/NlpA family ABC transporter substrate-binding protein [Geosporobacter subterraneus]SHJ27427.1 NitT/TauT family transport system substrate-binding protein [Geosporobacter subterraneus DSM 17957]
MLKFKKVFAILIASLLLLSLSACSSPKETPTSQRPKQTLNIGAISSVDVIPIIIAAEKGYFEKEGVGVNFQPFKSAKDRDAAFQGGNLDGIICDMVAVSLYQNADFDVKITGVTDGDFMLIANPSAGIKTMNDLIGKSIAISEKTCIEYMLDKILEKNGMESKDVQKSMVPPIPTRLEMLRNNKVDGALLPEPFATLAIQDGGILLGSANEEGFYPSVTAFTQQAINTKANEIKAFYRAYNEAVDYINNTPIAAYEDTIIKTVGYPEDMKGKITLPGFRKNELPSAEEIQSVIDWAAINGLVQKTLNPQNLLNDIGIQ